MNELLTKNFFRREYACQGTHCCGHSAPISIILVKKIQKLRQLLDVPLIIVSGFRCIIHNTEIGGVEDSEHTKGNAADILITTDDMYQVAKTLNIFGGIGRYDTFIHLDIGKKRDWDERTGSS